MDESRVVVSLDLGRLNLGAGILPPTRGWRASRPALGRILRLTVSGTAGRWGTSPDSFTHSTLGGWVATRSSGMQSDKYGDIADIVKGLRVVRAGGVLVIRAVPSASTGPSVREMVVGSEGRLGVITEVTVQVHRLPEKRAIHAYFFKNLDHGLAAMQKIAESDVSPSVTRISDAHETAFSLATSKESKGIQKKAQTGLYGVSQEAWLEPRRDVPLLHRLRGRRGTRETAEVARRPDRAQASRHRRRQGPRCALRPEEVRHAVHPRSSSSTTVPLVT